MRIGGVAAFIVVWGLATLSCATQSIAAVFSYQPALGAPAYRFATGEALYWPWSFVRWSLRHRAAFPRPFALADFILVIGNGAGAVLVLLALDARIPKTRRHGESGWATFNEARSAGLFANAGVVLGKCEGELLAYDGPGHVLLIGASRSGKGRGHVVPTLLAWPHSALVLDIKGELADGDARHDFAGTAGFREKLGAVLRFAPTQAKSARFNPLLEVRKGANEVRDVQNVVEIIVDPAGDARHNDFWDRSAKQVLVGLILHVLYAEPDERKTLATVRERLRDLDAVAQHMRQVAHRLNPTTGAPEVHPEVLHAAESYLSGEDRVRSGIKATAESFFGLFADPLVAANTSCSDFRLSDLMCAEAPTTLYLQPPPSDATRLMPLMRLLLNQAVRSLMERQTQAADGRNKRHALLLMLDEFPQLGRLSFFETAMGAFAGYGLKAYLVCQSLNHIARAYGRDSVIIDGQVIAQVTSPVFDSVSGEHLLIPQGARLIGAYDGGAAFGQRRLMLVWQRLVFPNGWSINLGSMPASDPSGAPGLRDRTDNHLDRLALAITLSAIISVVANESEDEEDEGSLRQSLGDAAAQQAAQTGSRIVERDLAIAPTLRIRSGAPVRVLVGRDIELRPYRR